MHLPPLMTWLKPSYDKLLCSKLHNKLLLQIMWHLDQPNGEEAFYLPPFFFNRLNCFQINVGHYRTACLIKRHHPKMSPVDYL